jgi:ABC-type transporter Mla subunit MlaD
MAFNKIKYLEKIVSVFVISAVVIVISTLLLIGRFQKWFASSRVYYSYLNSASGLEKGIAIKLRGVGFEIGKLEEFSLTKNNRVLIKISILDKYILKVRKDSVLYIRKPTIGFLGKVFLEISAGSPDTDELLKEAFIPSSLMFEGKLLISMKKAKGGDVESDSDLNLPAPIKNFLNRVNYILDPDRPYLKNFEEILFRVKGILTTVDKRGLLAALGSRAFHANIENITKSVNDIANRQIREIMDKVVSIMTTVEATSNTVIGVKLPRVMQNLENVLVRAESVLRNLERSPIFGGRGARASEGRENRRNSGRRSSVLLE